MSEWISAKTPPEDSRSVLVTYLGFYDGKPYSDGTACYDDGEWYWALDDSEVQVEITHWMELPPPAGG